MIPRASQERPAPRRRVSEYANTLGEYTMTNITFKNAAHTGRRTARTHAVNACAYIVYDAHAEKRARSARSASKFSRGERERARQHRDRNS